jgi:hypothetical protein
MQSVSEKKVKPGMSPARRWSGLYTVGLMLLLLVFFADHQWTHTGFFTSRFGYAEMVALYFPIVVSMLAPIVRTIQGRNETARKLDIISDVCLALGSLWLRITFPFDFAHLASVFPTSIQFAFGWVNNTIGQIILVLQVIIGVLSALSGLVSYARERGDLNSPSNTTSGEAILPGKSDNKY